VQKLVLRGTKPYSYHMEQEKKYVLVITGPTSVGKSDVAVRLAKEFNGEIISADSRQVYAGLDIGTGKITTEEMQGIPHFGLDLVDPQTVYSMADFQTYAFKKIQEIHSRGKVPILCGGTGFFIQSIVDNLLLPDVEPNEILREELKMKSADELFQILKEINPKKASEIDSQNPHRLIRAIEITKVLGTVPDKKKRDTPYLFIQIGLKLPKEELHTKIKTRLLQRIKEGMTEEVSNLHKEGLSWKRLEELGLEYRYTALYLQNKMSKQEMLKAIETKSFQYAKRQITWFKKDARIIWFNPSDYEKIVSFIKKEKKQDL